MIYNLSISYKGKHIATISTDTNKCGDRDVSVVMDTNNNGL